MGMNRGIQPRYRAASSCPQSHFYIHKNTIYIYSQGGDIQKKEVKHVSQSTMVSKPHIAISFVLLAALNTPPSVPVCTSYFQYATALSKSPLGRQSTFGAYRCPEIEFDISVEVSYRLRNWVSLKRLNPYPMTLARLSC